jgi:hypothetical protein
MKSHVCGPSLESILDFCSAFRAESEAGLGSGVCETRHVRCFASRWCDWGSFCNGLILCLVRFCEFPRICVTGRALRKRGPSMPAAAPPGGGACSTASREIFRIRLGHEMGPESSLQLINPTRIHCRASPVHAEGIRAPEGTRIIAFFGPPLRISLLY